MRDRPGPVLLLTALAVVVLDQATKWLVRARLPIGEPLWLIPHALSLDHVGNTGAAFSLLQGQRWVFVGITIVVLGAVAWAWYHYRPRNIWIVVALGLVVGGALGNLIDRAATGVVTDFIDAQVWPVFNVADSAVFVGECILIVWLLFFAGRGTATAGPSASEGAEGGGSDA